MREQLAEILETSPKGKELAGDLRKLIAVESDLRDLKIAHVTLDNSLARKLFPRASEKDHEALDEHPDDQDALHRIIATESNHSQFVAPESDEIGREYRVTVFVNSYPSRFDEKSATYFVTAGYPDTAKLLAVELYNDIVAALPKNSHAANSHAQVTLL